MKVEKYNWFLEGLIIIAAIPIILHMYSGSFSRFMGDDYCSAFIAKRLGVLRGGWYWYITWSGRYSANFLDGVFGVLGPKVTPLVTLLVLAIWLSTLTITIYFFLPYNQKRNLSAIGLSVSMLFITLNFSPNIYQSLYWGQGMRALVPSLILSTILFGYYFLVTDQRKTLKVSFANEDHDGRTNL